MIKKTIETDTDPCFILSSADESLPRGCLWLHAYWFEGYEGEVPPRINETTDGVILLGPEEVTALIEALQEFQK